ncbi:hypothetical protein M407DRAFT_28777 [Tulasnella calospora MUT 4182]|uniref:Uncharacterized protein n=1 Tax=Tulasnella calospora MUT 4182 TaxID=1051891 RepID=A0A0C3QA36_9AGAM|nr:hypothetical protein M407DRAFT_28777 [Tulasnella calospora MUT 4182]
MAPPSSLFSSASSSTAAPSPAKRRKLAGPASVRSWSKATSISSKSTLRPASSSSSAGTPFEDREHAAARRASVARVLSVWESLEQRYARAMDDDDIVDLRSGKLVQDRGVLKGSKSWQYGQLLRGGDAEDKEDGATTEGSEGLLTTGNDDEEEEEEEDEEEQRDPDQSLDELQLMGETNDGNEDANGGETASEDELGQWDTVPAPPSTSPSPNGSPSQSRASSPGPAFLTESRPTTPGTLSTFLQANFRPKLEKLAREREDSPLPPADDLEAFMAAEQSMKSRTKPGYVEPEAPSDDDEVVFLGYSTGQEGVGTSDADERGEIGGNEDSEDELNDWDTVPAPASDPDEEAEDQEEELLAPYDPPSEPSSDSDPEPSRLAAHSRSFSEKEPRPPRKPPSLNRTPSKPAKPSKDADRAIGSSSEGLSASPTKSKSNPSLNNKATPKRKGSSSSTTLTPTLNRLMHHSTAEIRRTPSRHLIPEVVIPVYGGTSSSPTKTSQTAQPSPKKQTKASSQSLASKPRTSFTPLSDSEDDVPLMSRQMPKHPPAKTNGPKPKYIEIESDEEDLPTRREVGRSTRDQSGSSPSKPKRDQTTRSKSRDGAGPTKSGKRKEKGKAETKKRKRDSVEEVQVETQFVERMGSLGLEDSDDEIQEGDARRRATAAWQRAVSVERPVRHSTPPRTVSPVLNERHNAYQVEPVHHEFEEYDQPAEPPSRADPIPQNPPQALQTAPPPVPQPPVPQLQQQALPTPQLMQPSSYQGFYYPTGYPYMQMQMPMQMQVPMAMPMPMAPQFYYPPPASPATFIQTPPVPAPQPQSPQQQQAGTPNAGHEALLTQVLYTLNYLTHQNGGNLPGNPQQQSAPAVTPAAPKDSDGFAIPLLPETPQQEWRVASTPVTSVPSRQPVYDSDSPSYGRSILRVGGSRSKTAGAAGSRSSLGLSLDPKGKGKEVAYPDFSDAGSDNESRRAMSVTFSDPPSVDTPKGRYAPMLPSPVVSKFQQFAVPRPSPLRKSSSNLDMESGADQQDGAWASPSSSPTKRSGRQPLAPSNTMSSLGRRGSDGSTSSAPLSNSSAVLAKARAALSSSLATTASFTTPKSTRTGRR